jgi:hypothetical protein
MDPKLNFSSLLLIFGRRIVKATLQTLLLDLNVSHLHIDQ